MYKCIFTLKFFKQFRILQQAVATFLDLECLGIHSEKCCLPLGVLVQFTIFNIKFKKL